MYIRKTQKTYKGKTYENYLLVESYQTPKGPRQKTICSLGNLKARSGEEWLQLARTVEKALIGQIPLLEQAPEVNDIITKVKAKEGKKRAAVVKEEIVPVKTDGVKTQEHREAGPVHVGHSMWERLEMDRILAEAGLDGSTKLLTQAMVLNRLIAPSSEYSMPDWIRRTALSDILDVDFEKITEDALYRNMDKLYPARGHIERELSKREESLFNLDTSLYFYDLTSTYFEGDCLKNEQAKRGYSRDKRPDCKQVVIGLVVDREGFPKAHEIFDGNRNDSTTVEEMLTVLEGRIGKKEGATVIVDRGMAYDSNLKQIKDKGYHYIVAAKPYELNQWLDEFEEEADWQEIVRESSPLNPFQKKARLIVKSKEKGEEVYLLCNSDGRKEKDKAIREAQEKKLIKDIGRLKSRIEKGRLKKETKIHQAIGRLKERYKRVARYYNIDFDSDTSALLFNEVPQKRELAEKLDGSYIIKTDRKDMTDEEIWRTYILLTRVENAFRNLKSPLGERPIFHQLKNRVQTHIFLCLLAYHLLICIEKTFLNKGIHTSWGTIREILSTHQVATVVLPTDKGNELHIRKGSTPEKEHREIYDILGISHEVMGPKKIWSGEKGSDGKNEKCLKIQ